MESVFDVFGKIHYSFFVLSGFLPRVLALLRWVDHVDEKGEPVYTNALPWFYQHVCKDIASDLRIGSLLYALCMIAFMGAIAYLLDKRKFISEYNLLELIFKETRLPPFQDFQAYLHPLK